MSITFYTTRAASPAARSVETVIRILKLDVKRHEINLQKQENRESWFEQINPARQVPVLNDNGYILIDSHAIATYLLTSYAPKNILEQYYPTDAKQRGIVDSRLHFENGTLFARMKTIVVPLLLRGVKDIPIEKTQDLAESVEVFEKLLEGKEWLAGDRLTIADIFAIKTIDLIQFLIPLKHYKNVSAWSERARKVCPFYEEVSREQINNFSIAFKRTTYDTNYRWNQIQNSVKK